MWVLVPVKSGFRLMVWSQLDWSQASHELRKRKLMVNAQTGMSGDIYLLPPQKILDFYFRDDTPTIDVFYDDPTINTL